ncbi:hypothetical protein GW765_04965 [Candidatus Parcubacteria bacterium]|nr:hypothetical protein [Candidatus Parcubacteria bacterium]
MNQKIIIISIVIIIAVVGVIGYFVFVQKPAFTPAPTKEGGAGGSGLAEFPPASKYCEDRNAPKEKIFGETLIISSDKKTILLNDKVAVSISDLPTTVQVSANSSFGVTNKEFTSAVLSPTKSIIAFTVSGGAHGWGGFKNVFSGLVYPVAFQFGGSVSNPKWNHDGKYISFSKTIPKPATILTLVNAQGLKTYTSEYEKVLSFEDINPLPYGILSNLRSHYWSEDKDNKLYFLVALMDSAVNVEHAELWSVNADTSKWDFYCTSY